MPRLSKIGAAALAAFGWTTGGASVTASYLVVAGGAGGGAGLTTGGGGAGAGAGGYRTGTASLNPTLSYTVTVGAGGTGATSDGIRGASGSDSVFNAITSTGGGGGSGRSTSSGAGSNGGSGGGATFLGTIGAGNTPSTSPSQGNNGGTGDTVGGGGGGGGGGASAVGTNAGLTTAGNGGAGTASSITGSSVTYAGGGGGGNYTGNSAGSGGAGGGGAGAISSSAGTAGTANLGGGGGGGGAGLGVFAAGGNGGSGIVIISYVGAQQFSGGVVTSSGGNTIHTFTTSGTLGPVTPLSANYLVVAGGGSGGGGYFAGGGGAGGLLSGSSLTIDPYSTYLVTVGAGAAAVSGNSTNGLQGSNSAFSMVATAAVGGGYGAGYGGSGVVGGVGGSGGGTAANALATVAAGTSGQGNAGGQSSNNGGGGGGGAGSVGGNAGASFGTGGTGSASSISGASVTYAAGAAGGITGVGNGASGTANTGNGGAASSASGGTSGAGGSGVVIISYAGSTQLMAGGVVTIAGGNVIHTFNSSGYLTPLTLLTRSLRFRSSASAYLSRTPASTSNQTTWTWSAWVKRGVLSQQQTLFGAANSGDPFLQLVYDSSANSLDFIYYVAGVVGRKTTTAAYRDPSSWYHVLVNWDTTNATASDRMRIYINGIRVTSFSASTDPAQNTTGTVNSSSYGHSIGRLFSTTNPFDGYMAEVNFIDGQALAPTAFGTVNSYGVWQPITYGGSYGTNGFRLPFTNNASTTTLGYDFSPQGNNWTTNNISVTAGSTYDSMTDVPTLTSATAANYCTLNPLNKNASSITVVDGNLGISTSASNVGVAGTIGVSTGKWYWETTFTNASGVPSIGAATAAWDKSYAGYTSSVGYHGNGVIYNNGSNVQSGLASYTSGDVIGVALDLSAGSIAFYKNNVQQGTTITGLTGEWFPAVAGQTSSTLAANFGQRPFAYTPPTGYLALNTFNL